MYPNRVDMDPRTSMKYGRTRLLCPFGVVRLFSRIVQVTQPSVSLIL